VEGIESMHSGAKERTWLTGKRQVATIAHTTHSLSEVMMNIRLVIEPHASEALKEFVREGLALYNVAATGAAEYYPVCLFLKNEVTVDEGSAPPASAAEPCVKVALHTAPQPCGACHAHRWRSHAVFFTWPYRCHSCQCVKASLPPCVRGMR
jgi:hypothetical protein